MKKMFAFAGIMSMLTLTACQAGQDAVVVQTASDGSKQCWLLKDQTITHMPNGAIHWQKATFLPWNFSAIHSVNGMTDIVHTPTYFEWSKSDFVDQAKQMGIDDITKCSISR